MAGGNPTISAHSISEIHVFGRWARVILFDWFAIDGVWQKRVVGTVKTPIESPPTEVDDMYKPTTSPLCRNDGFNSAAGPREAPAECRGFPLVRRLRTPGVPQQA